MATTAGRRPNLHPIEDEVDVDFDPVTQSRTRVGPYHFGRELGSGSFGTVFAASRRRAGPEDADGDEKKLNTTAADDEFAIKVISKKRLKRARGLGGPARRAADEKAGPGAGPAYLQPLQQEIDTLRRLSHPNVVRLVDVLQAASHDSVYMVFELLGLGPVMEIAPGETVPPIPASIARLYAKQLVSALSYVHGQGIVHRDVKPANLLRQSLEHIKLADFGAAHTFEGNDDTLTKTAGTPAFMAPESVDPGVPSFRGRPADVWAAGVTLFCMVFGMLPFGGMGIQKRELWAQIRDMPLNLPCDTDPPISSTLSSLLSQLLDKEPQLRLTLDAAAQSPWLTDSPPESGNLKRPLSRSPGSTPPSGRRRGCSTPTETMIGDTCTFTYAATPALPASASGTPVAAVRRSVTRTFSPALHHAARPRASRPGRAGMMYVRQQLSKHGQRGDKQHKETIL